MATKEEIKDALNGWIDKIKDPEIAEEFEDFDKTMQFKFSDIKYNIKMIFKDKAACLEEGLDDKAEMSLETNSDLFVGIATGDVDPMEAYMEGDLIVTGDMNAIQRLEVFMDF